MENIQNFELFFLLSWILIITPGPDLIYVLTKGISQGKKAGLISAMGVTLGILVHTIFAALGLSIILKTSAIAFSIVKYAGAAYLVFLGIKSIIEKSDLKFGESKSVNHKKLFVQGLLSNTLNPKVALFFMAFLPQFVNSGSNSGTAIPFIILGLSFAFFTLIFLSLLALSSGSVGQHLKKNNRISNWIQKTSRAVLIMLGIRLAFVKQK